MQPKILVIGSRDHDRAYCVDWQQPFPNIEEYDSIIINLQSLTQDMYDKIQKKIRRIRKSITTVFKTDREIFCLINKLIHPSPAPRPTGAPVGIRVGYTLPTNYVWVSGTTTRKCRAKKRTLACSLGKEPPSRLPSAL